ncbi:MAG: hypothetical protein HY830_25860 [Actinobacteria bacterium]|nr:hypothetical protein [Actinomycetota bacterium]
MSAETEQQAQGDTFGSYLGVLRRRWVTLVVVAVLVFGLGAAWLLQGSGGYRATAAVLVQPIVEDPFGGARSDSVNLATEREVADSVLNATWVKEHLDAPGTPQSLLKGLQVTALAETEILKFTYKASGAETARLRAQAFADGYLAVRAEAAQKSIDAAAERFEAKATDLEQRLSENLAAQATTAPNSVERARLAADQEAIEQQLRAVQERIVDLGSVETKAGRVVKTAGSAHRVATTRTLVVLAAAALVLGVIAAFLRDRFDPRLRSAGDVRRAGLPPVLAEVGPDRGSGKWASFGRVRARLGPSLGATETVLVAGVDSSESATAVASGLAASFVGARRALVAIGGTATTVERTFRLGAAEAGDRALAVRPVPQVTGLSLVTGLGDKGTSATEVRRCLDALRGEFDVVVAVLEPLGADGPLDVAVLFDAVVLVVEAQSSRIAPVVRLVQDLHEVGATVVGSVLVRGGDAE